MNARRAYGTLSATVFVALLLFFFYSVAGILLLAFIGVLFALYLSAIMDALQRRFALPRGLGLLAALLLTALGLTLIGYLIVPPVVEQTQELIVTLPALLSALEADLLAFAQRSPVFAQFLGPLGEGESYVGSIIQEVGGYFRGLVPYLYHGFGFVIHVFSVFVMGIYLAARPGMYVEGLIALAPPVHRDLVRDVLDDLGQTLRAWIVGQLIAMLILGVLTWIGFIILKVPYALAFAVFTGLVAIVPFFGTLVSTLLPAIFVLAGAGAVPALLVALLGVVIHIVEANFVAPMVMERQVHLPPVLTLLSVLIMAELLGVIGLLVAVPVLAVGMVVARRIYVERVLEGKGFRRAVRDQPIEIRLPSDDSVVVHPAAYQQSIPAMLER
ncbi:MAG: AI-2E family transporter [Longimicrobiales bacterium]